jgi:hypothetical protein
MMNLNDTPGAGPLTESDLDAAIRDSWPPLRDSFPACTADACCHGRVPCPTPEDCRLDDLPRDPMTRTEACLLVAVYVLSALAVVAAIAALIR